MIKELISAIPKFYDDVGKRVYRRIFAGMVWPFDKPGAVVVLGEADSPNPMTGENDIWIIDEYEAKSVVDVVVRCVEARGLMKVQKIFGDTDNREMMMVMRKSEGRFKLSKAPYVDSGGAEKFYLTLIREKVSAAKKVLNFGDKKAIPPMLGSIGTDGKIELPPLVLALGYALAAFAAYPYKNPAHSAGVHVSYHQPLDAGIGH